MTEEAAREDLPDSDLVVRLLEEQAPHLAGRAVTPSTASGSSNWVFRLGDAQAVRLPRTEGYAEDLLKEVRWLPRLGPALPVPVPRVDFAGAASEIFPRPWTVVSWLPGELPTDLDSAQQAELATTLGHFLRSLHDVDAVGVPHGADHWGYRAGEPVTDTIDEWADHAATRLADIFDPEAVRRAWRLLRDVPPVTSSPCWIHTDLSAENMLVRADGGLAGVLDWGGLGVGDRSVDLLYAWSMFDAPARDLLRVAAAADDATWARARAWAFVGPGLLTIEDYRRTMPGRTARLIAMVTAIAAEVGVRLR
ncbi:aminoglycoside phosphotransferase family protein [Microbacterium sp. 13-71-7]|uniref:aminoglycoside phosphotransferase family protein n=1 Tax=Microbacterium sp. 13-71-7 TaxID=1970399 RepID=UPI000BD3D379|nr:aminoglycoside phosphotransferase family protein [Microbacterium sp. 13-71-7]OZB81579.1 MAG: phosphotransferase [Microbacterium sp. 13-71-7]